MNYERPLERLASLADEYVVGTLTGRARRRFDRLLVTSALARTAVQRAEDRLLGLGELLPAVQPSPATWTAIERRVFAADLQSVRRAPSMGWRLALAAAIVGLAIGLGWLVYRAEVPRSVQVAQVRTEGGAALWTVSTDPSATRLTTRASAAVRQQAGHDYELWALPEGRAPVSLGVLPASGAAERTLDATQRAALRSAPKVAVSLEPVGGSPTGAPTGPVLYVADVEVAQG
jgi:anti-sigma-K factor RskA